MLFHQTWLQRRPPAIRLPPGWIPPFAGRHPPFAESAERPFSLPTTLQRSPVRYWQMIERSRKMASNHYPFWTHDTVAAAVLAGVGTASFQSRLDAWAGKLNVPAVTAMVHGWPMLMIFIGLVLLVIHPMAEMRATRTTMTSESTGKL